MLARAVQPCVRQDCQQACAARRIELRHAQVRHDPAVNAHCLRDGSSCSCCIKRLSFRGSLVHLKKCAFAATSAPWLIGAFRQASLPVSCRHLQLQTKFVRSTPRMAQDLRAQLTACACRRAAGLTAAARMKEETWTGCHRENAHGPAQVAVGVSRAVGAAAAAVPSLWHPAPAWQPAVQRRCRRHADRRARRLCRGGTFCVVNSATCQAQLPIGIE